ncbi:hypothetical protein WA158_000691 [Blastocystis sp. Blastoise]
MISRGYSIKKRNNKTLKHATFSVYGETNGLEYRKKEIFLTFFYLQLCSFFFIKMNNNQKKSLIIVGSVAAASIASYFIYKHFSKKSVSEEKKDENNQVAAATSEVAAAPETVVDTKATVEETATSSAAEETAKVAKETPKSLFIVSHLFFFITFETMIAIFKEIGDNAETLAQAIGQNQAQIAATVGGNNELAIQILSQQFQSSLAEIETQVYTKYKTTEEEVVKNSKLLNDDIDFKRAVFPLRVVASLFTGVEPDNVEELLPADMTIEKTLKVFEAVNQLSFTCLKDSLDEYIKENNLAGMDEAKHLLETDENAQVTILQNFSKKTEEARDSVFSKYGVDKTIFQIAIANYGQSPEFAEGMQKLNSSMQENFASLGLAPSM